VQHAPGGAVPETHLLESDGAALNLQGNGVGPVRHLSRHRNRAHALLHDADILENRRHVLRDPAGDRGDVPGQRQRHRNGTDRNAAIVPQPDRDNGGADDEARIQHGQAQPERRGQPQLRAERIGEVVHCRTHEFVLIARPGEQLDGLDICVAVHDAARERRSRLRHAPRADPQTRHKIVQQGGVTGKP